MLAVLDDLDLDRFIEDLPIDGRKYPWSPSETEELRRFWGMIPKEELAGRITMILRERTGDPGAIRTVSAIAVRAAATGLKVYKGDETEIYLNDAATFAGVSFNWLWKDHQSGKLPTNKKQKFRYVSYLDLAHWLLDLRAKEEARAGILEAVEGEDIITKKEAMALTSLSETHITRYLETGIIRAWKLPDMTRGDRGEWLVDRRSVRAFLEMVKKGKLGELLDASPKYLEIREKQNREIRDLRRRGRIEKRDPLDEPKSSYFPGCFTVSQVASHLGVSTQSLYTAIEMGVLKAEVRTAGGRSRYGITPEEARRFIKGTDRKGLSGNRRKTFIHNHNLFTTEDLSRRWQVGPETIGRWARVGKSGAVLSGEKWGRYITFRPEEVERFEQEAGLVTGGLFTVQELAKRWGYSETMIRYFTRIGKNGVVLSGHKRGKLGIIFEPEEVERFEQESGIVRESDPLTVKDLSRRWGISKASIHLWTRKGRNGTILPARKLGGVLFFDPAEVEQFEQEAVPQNRTLTMKDLMQRWNRDDGTIFTWMKSGKNGVILPQGKKQGKFLYFELEVVERFEREAGLSGQDLLTAQELAERWNCSVSTIHAWSRFGRDGVFLPSGQGDLKLVFHREKVECFEKEAGLIYRDLITTEDLVTRWGRSKALIRLWTRTGKGGTVLKARRYGKYLYFEPAEVERFEKEAGLA